MTYAGDLAPGVLTTRLAGAAPLRLFWPTLPRPLLVFLAVQVLAWTLMPGLIFAAPHPNTIEIAMWGRDWYWVGAKHPALASWLLDGAYLLFGNHLFVPFLLAQFCIAATYLMVFLLGRDTLGEESALAGTLTLAAIEFFTVAALEFNHNLGQMPLWVAVCYGLWKCSGTRRPGWWLFLGAVAALAVFAKLSSLMVIGFGAVWILADPAARSRLRGVSPWLGLALFLLLLAPLAVGLAETQFRAVGWIAVESSHRGISTAKFLLSEAKLVFALLLLTLIGVFVEPIAAILIAAAAAWRRDARSTAPAAPPLTDRRSRRFLLLMGAGPLVLTLLLSLFAALRVEWTAPMFSLAGLLLVAFWPRAGWLPSRGIGVAFVALLATLGSDAIQGTGALEHRYNMTGLHWDSWPLEKISQRFDTIWWEDVGSPLRIVGGDSRSAGAVGLESIDRPALYPDLDPGLAPAMTAARVQHDGMLVLWTPSSAWQPPKDLLSRSAHGKQLFVWSQNPKAAPLEIDYLIVPPLHWRPTV